MGDPIAAVQTVPKGRLRGLNREALSPCTWGVPKWGIARKRTPRVEDLPSVKTNLARRASGMWQLGNF